MPPRRMSMRVGTDTPLIVRSFSSTTGPGAMIPMNPVLGLPAASLVGQASRILAVPVMVKVSPCLTVVREKVVSIQATVRMRRNASWARSPWAEAAGAAPTSSAPATTAAQRTRRIRRRIVITTSS
jgi:hypothetical protein